MHGKAVAGRQREMRNILGKVHRTDDQCNISNRSSDAMCGGRDGMCLRDKQVAELQSGVVRR